MAQSAAPESIRILALGDSLTAGYGLGPGQSFADQLQALLLAEGAQVQVINAGVSGDTSAGGLARLDWLLSDPQGGPDIALVELGANDGLQGLEPSRMQANLDAIVARLKESGALVLLCGIKALPNFGPDYAEAFQAAFQSVAAKHAIPLHSAFLQDVLSHPELLQPDGLHPNRAGTEVVAKGALPHVRNLVQKLQLSQP